MIALLLFLVTSRTVTAQSEVVDEPEANPGRPTVSTPATLTPVGYLQFETGFTPAYDSPEFSSRYGLSEVIKLAVASRLEFVASGRGAGFGQSNQVTWHASPSAFPAEFNCFLIRKRENVRITLNLR